MCSEVGMLRFHPWFVSKHNPSSNNDYLQLITTIIESNDSTSNLLVKLINNINFYNIVKKQL